MTELDPPVWLRPTERADLEFVLRLERSSENRPFIAQWSSARHVDAIDRPDREHWVIERRLGSTPTGYLIAFNLIPAGFGVYVKRIVIAEKSRGLGRMAMRLFVQHAFDDLGAPFVWLTVFAENTRAQRSMDCRARIASATCCAARNCELKTIT
jgi:RimJ/RimL family protein N-acetyltransferase